MGVDVIAGIVAGALGTAAFVPYLRSTFRGETKPNRATWWILTFVGFMLAASYYSLGARLSMWLALTYVLCPLATAIVSLKYGEGGWTQFDRACVVGACLSGILWWLSSSPFIALLLNIAIDFCGVLPTIRKSYFRPESEDRLAWTIAFVASAINLFAVEQWDLQMAVYPIYIVIGNATIMALLCRRRSDCIAVLVRT